MIKSIKKFGLIVLLAFTFSSVAIAQQNDFEVWTTAIVRKEINKKIRVAVEEEFRFHENVTKINKFHTDLSLTYTFSDFLSVAGCYRFIEERKYGGYYSKRHRFYADINLSYNYDRFSFTYRSRWQTKYTDIFTDQNGLVPSSYMRNKLSVKYDVRGTRFVPFVSCEYYYDLNASEIREFKKVRYTFGADYKMKNKNTASVFFRLQNDINQSNPVSSKIIGLCYVHKL